MYTHAAHVLTRTNTQLWQALSNFHCISWEWILYLLPVTHVVVMDTQRAERCSQNWDASRILSRGVAPPQSCGTRWGRFEGIGSEGLSGRTVTGFTLVLTSLTPQRRMYGLNSSAAGSYLPKCSLQAFEIRNFRNENLEMTVLPETGYFLLSKALVILKTQFYCFNYLK